MNAELREAVERADKARNFPHNTCASSRHVQLMAEALASGKQYPMLAEEPAYCAESMLATVAALYEARTALRDQEAEIARLRRNLQAYADNDWVLPVPMIRDLLNGAEIFTAHLGGENNG